MAIYAPKACKNKWFLARTKASEFNEPLGSREGASEELGIEKTRLARIETGIKNPYPDEVVMMAEVYKCPELKNYYCREMCPLGHDLPVIEDITVERLVIRAIRSMREIGTARETLLDIMQDGIVDQMERADFELIIAAMEELGEVTQNLKNWAKKNLE